MFAEEYKGINSFLIGASNLLCKYGVKRNVTTQHPYGHE